MNFTRLNVFFKIYGNNDNKNKIENLKEII